MKISRESTIPYITKDGSEIREFVHPSHLNGVRQSLAEATVHPGKKTMSHRHHLSEEIYYITAGSGIMFIDDDPGFTVVSGDAVYIPAGSRHYISNTGTLPLVFLCCCTPPYSHDDTTIMESGMA